MMIQLVAQHPEALGSILRNTPTWVWGLAAGLGALGASQLRARKASLARVSVMPLVMSAFSAWGTTSAFGNSALLPQAIAIWLAAAVILAAAVSRLRARASYDAATRTYALPGSVVPLALIMGIFLVKYVVGVDLAMAPNLMHDTQYALSVAGLYGAFSGIFIGRAARLWRLALPTRAAVAA
jgi:hypothetical protein